MGKKKNEKMKEKNGMQNHKMNEKMNDFLVEPMVFSISSTRVQSGQRSYS